MKEDNVDYIIYLMRRYTKTDEPKTKEEFGEQDAAAGGGAAGGKGYPTVTKWTSGRKFGATYNPEQKTWASGVTRGKANTLL
jgi:hypothetical protein